MDIYNKILDDCFLFLYHVVGLTQTNTKEKQSKSKRIYDWRTVSIYVYNLRISKKCRWLNKKVLRFAAKIKEISLYYGEYRIF